METALTNSGVFQFASGSIHFAASLELTKREISEGKFVSYFFWGSGTSFPCRMGVYSESLRHKIPRKNVQLIRRISSNVNLSAEITFNAAWVENALTETLDQLSKLSRIDDLRELEFDGAKPGPAIANEIVTLTKDRNLHIPNYYPLLARLLRSYYEVYSATQQEIILNKLTKIYIFNGRFLHERAVWDAAKAAKIEVIIFETTRDRLHERPLGFHNRVNNQKLMIENWNTSKIKIESKNKISDEWFCSLRSKSNPFHTLDQKKMQLQRPYFVYFSNSDDEAIGFWDEWNQVLGEQIECVKKLQHIFSNQDEYDLIIRLHPNLASKQQQEIDAWTNLPPKNNSIIVGPSRDFSSYQLLDQSIGVMTFGSTLGIEAAFALKPCLVLADCKFDELGIADKATSWDYVSAWISNALDFDTRELSIRKEKSRIFGFFLATGGTEFKYTKLQNIGWGAWEATEFLGLRFQEKLLFQYYRKFISKLKFYRIRKLVNFE